MIDWIALTKCATCHHVEKRVFSETDRVQQGGTSMDVVCPRCGNPARLIAFPAFEVETIDTSLPRRFSYDRMEDW
jgi:hypothetical protein